VDKIAEQTAFQGRLLKRSKRRLRLWTKRTPVILGVFPQQ
jgi:hypothetical protein